MPNTSYHNWPMPTVDGSTDTWGTELNTLFDDNIDAIVERRGTLANRPAASNVPNGAKYLVTSGDETGTLYIESGDSWVDIGSLGAYGVPPGETVADIDTALSNNPVVVLKPGETYTHNGTATINHTAGDGLQTVLAHGSTVEVRGTVVDTSLDTFQEDEFNWYGGLLAGTKTDGEIAFRITDSAFAEIHPAYIDDCEFGVILENEEAFCEMCSVSFHGRGNRIPFAALGNDSTGVRSVTGPSGSGGGTQSFRKLELNMMCSPDVTGESDTVAGAYFDEGKAYHSDIYTSVNVDADGGNDIIGLRMSRNFAGADIFHHTETPGGKSGGIGVQIDKLERPPSEWHTQHRGSSITAVVNNTDAAETDPNYEPIVHEDYSTSGQGGTTWGPETLVDGDVFERWSDKYAPDDRARIHRDHTKVYRRGTEGHHVFEDDTGTELFTLQKSGFDSMDWEGASALNSYRFRGAPVTVQEQFTVNAGLEMNGSGITGLENVDNVSTAGDMAGEIVIDEAQERLYLKDDAGNIGYINLDGTFT